MLRKVPKPSNNFCRWIKKRLRTFRDGQIFSEVFLLEELPGERRTTGPARNCPLAGAALDIVAIGIACWRESHRYYLSASFWVRPAAVPGPIRASVPGAPMQAAISVDSRDICRDSRWPLWPWSGHRLAKYLSLRPNTWAVLEAFSCVAGNACANSLKT